MAAPDQAAGLGREKPADWLLQEGTLGLLATSTLAFKDGLNIHQIK